VQNNNRHSELLLKLAQGRISEKEKWELERASLDDAFLADALEGYYDSKAKHDLSAVPIQSKTITSKPEIEPIRRSLFKKWAGIAASLLILFSISFWAFNQFETDSTYSESIVESSKAIDKIEQLEDEEELQNLNNVINSDNIADDELIISENQNRLEEVEITDEYQNDTPSAPKSNIAKKSKKIAKPQNQQKEKDLGFQKRNSASKPIRKEQETQSLEDIESIPIKLVKGTVKDPNGIPLKNVSLTSNDGIGPVFTDENGDFEMSLNQDDNTINILAEGFVPTKIQTQPKLDIKLKKAEQSLSAPPKRLAELMSPQELKEHYKNQLDKYLKKQNIRCNESFDKWKKIKIKISIDDSNFINNIVFIDDIDLSCKLEIENIIRQTSLENLFDGSQNVNFTYTIHRF